MCTYGGRRVLVRFLAVVWLTLFETSTVPSPCLLAVR